MRKYATLGSEIYPFQGTEIRKRKSVQYSLRREHDAAFVARLKAFARIPDDRLAR